MIFGTAGKHFGMEKEPLRRPLIEGLVWACRPIEKKGFKSGTVCYGGLGVYNPQRGLKGQNRLQGGEAPWNSQILKNDIPIYMVSWMEVEQVIIFFKPIWNMRQINQQPIIWTKLHYYKTVSNGIQ